MNKKLLEILKTYGNVAVNRFTIGDDEGKKLLKEIKEETNLDCRVKTIIYQDDYGRKRKNYVIEVI